MTLLSVMFIVSRNIHSSTVQRELFVAFR